MRGKTAIVGIGEAQLWEAGAGFGPWDLAAMACHDALNEAGLQKSDVDGLFTASSYGPFGTLEAGEYLGIRPRYSDGSNVGGSSFVSHLLHASAAIQSGLCEVALITYGSTQRSESGRLVSPSRPLAYEAPYKPRYPISMYALAASRHMYEFGTSREQLAEVAVAARAWAQLNPAAFARDPLTIDDVLSARMVSDPLSVRDCCLVTDGGGAVIMTSSDRARTLPAVPVYLLGAGEAHHHRNISQMPELSVSAVGSTNSAAYEMARLGPQDVDVVELYDAFTINTIMFLEDLGFCAKGQGGPFVENGGIAPGGRLPVNTNGGGLSYCHPGMYGIFLIIEAVRQIRGVCGDRQQRDVDVALVHGNGGVFSSAVTALLGSEAAVTSC